MSLFSINSGKAKKIKATSIGLEKDLQRYFENNLEEILDISFLHSEYVVASFGGRIDTLGIDKDGSPVIIEYKRSQNDNVINQGLFYLKRLKDHKAEFELLCRKSDINIDIDRNSPRVICVAESYNKFDIHTVDMLPIRIELYKYVRYENHILSVELEKIQQTTVGFKKQTIKAPKEGHSSLQQTYSLEDHKHRGSEKINKIFEKLREYIVSLDESISEEFKKCYIAYKLTSNFVDIEIGKTRLKVHLNIKSGDLRDPSNIAKDMTHPVKVGHLGNGDYEVSLTNDSNIEYIYDLIQQAYKYNK